MAYLQLPDGSYFQFDDALPDDKAYALAKQKHPDAFGIKPQEGLGAAFKKGAEQFASSGITGIRSLFGNAQTAAEEGLQQQQNIGARYADQVSWDRVKQKYDDPQGGLFSAAGEVARQVPLAIAEQAPNIAATLGSAKAGAMAGAPFAAAFPPAPLIGAGIGAVIPSFLQLFGGNVVRQQEATPGQVNAGNAALAAVPQAGLDAVGTLVPLGKTVVGKLLGPQVEAFLAKGGSQAAEKLARESLKATLAKGTAVGVMAEVPTEVAQQMLERLQAGLSLTDADALDEYKATAYQTGLLGPIGAGGRYMDRNAARGEVAEAKRMKDAKAAADAAAAEEQRKQTPEYLTDLTQRYDAATQQKAGIDAKIKELQASLKTAPAQDKRDIESQIRQLKLAQGTAANELKPLQVEYDQRLPEIKAAREQQRLAGLNPMEVLVGEQAPEGASPDATPFTDMAQTPVAPAGAPAQPNYLQDHIRALEDPNAAAVGESTLDPREVVASLLERPDLAKRMLSSGEQFPGTKSMAESNLWKKELAKQLKVAMQEPAKTEDSTAAMQQIIGDREAMDRESLAEQMAAAREQSAQRQQDDAAQADLRQRQAAEFNATADTADEIGLATRAQGMQLGDSRRTPNTVKQLEDAIDEGIVTPTVARALRIGDLSDPLDLSDPKAAAKALPMIQARLQELVDIQQQTLANERVQLTRPDGTPTNNAAEMQRVEANLAELRRLETHAKRALDPNAAADESFVAGALENAAPKRTPSIDVGQGQGLQKQQYGARAAELAGRHEELVTELYSQLDELARGTFFKSPELEQRSPSAIAFDSTERVRKPNTAQAMSLEKGLVDKAEAAKREIVKNMLQEAAARREATGAPGLTQQEAGAAARDVRSAIDALIDQSRRVDDSGRIWEDDASKNEYVKEASGKTWTIGGRRKTTEQKVRGRTDPAYAQVRMQKTFTDAAGIANEIIERTRQALLNPPKKPGLADAVKTTKPMAVEGVRKAAFDLSPQTEKGTQAIERRAAGEGTKDDTLRATRRIENTIDRLEDAQLKQRNSSARVDRESVAVLEKARQFLLGTGEKIGRATPRFLDAVDAAIERVSKGMAVDPDTGRAIIEHINSIDENVQDQRNQQDMFAEPTALVAKDGDQFQRMLDSRRRSEGPDNPKFQAWLSRLNENIERAENEIDALEQKYQQFTDRGYNTESVQQALADLRVARGNLASLKDQRTVLKSINKPELDGNKSSLVREIRKVNDASAEMQKAIAKAKAQAAKAESQGSMSLKRQEAAERKLLAAKDALRKADLKDDPKAYAAMKERVAQLQAEVDEATAQRNVTEGRLAEPRETTAPTSQPAQPAPGTDITKLTTVTQGLDIGSAKRPYVVPVERKVVQRSTVQTVEQKREALKAKVREEMEDRARQRKLKEELRSQGVAREQTRGEKAETARAMVGASNSKGEEIRKNLPTMGKGAPETKLRVPVRTRDVSGVEDMGTPPPMKALPKKNEGIGKPAGSPSDIGVASRLKEDIAAEQTILDGYEARLAKLEKKGAAKGPNAYALRQSIVQTTKTLEGLKRRFELADRLESRKKKSSDVRESRVYGTLIGSKTEHVQADVASLLGDTGSVVTVVENVDALPPSLRKKITSPNTQAFTHGSDVYLIADRIAPGAARGVALHEVGVHVGMDEATINRLYAAMQTLAQQDTADGRRAAAILQAVNAQPDSVVHESRKGETAQALKDEAVAYFVEGSVNAGVNPSAPPGGLEAFFKPLVEAVKAALAKLGLRTDNLTAQDFVDYAYGAAKMALEQRNRRPEKLSFSQKLSYAEGDDAALQALDRKIIARPTPFADKFKANILGFRTQFIDRFDPLEKIASTMADSLKASQMMYWTRMYGQRNNFMAEVSSNGPLSVESSKRADGRTEYMVKSKDGASLQKIADLLRGAGVGSADAVDTRFKVYLIAERAERTGFNSVVGYVPKDVTEADLKRALAAGRANPAFQKARKMYQEYNDGLIDFAVQTGALGEDLGKLLKSSQDYVSFYRKDGDSISLIIDGEKIGTMGSLKNQPYLQELVGGDDQMTGFFDGALRNTHLLTDMALRNIAARNTANTLQELGLAKIGKGDGPAGKTTVRFREHGADRYAVIDTDTMGIPPELVAYGLEGISTQLPAAFKLLGIPARLLRHFIVRNPVYAFRQVFRDSVANVLMTGADFTPVLGPMKEMVQMWRGKSNAEADLQERGVVGGQVLTGDIEDRATILKQLQSGKLGWSTAMAKLDFMAMQADAASRVSAYKSFRAQGLSDMEATLATLETMNFNRRGVSPTIHALGTMIPFMNAQLQGLDVLYRAATGKMPFTERLQVQRKFMTRGLMIAAATMMYASMMGDDDDYKNATADERYNNWFVPIPGTDEKIKVPIPFEPGYIFKSLPEAMYNLAFTDESSRNVLDAFVQMGLNTMPGVIPQGVKPLIEAALNRNFFTGREIEDVRMQGLKAGERYTDRTTDVAKGLGGSFEIAGREIGVSPAMIEHLVRGYTGSLGMAILGLGNALVPDRVDKPTPKLSETPIAGPLFLEKDASGAVNEVYKQIEAVSRAKGTFDKLVKEGREEEAMRFAEKYADQLSRAELAAGSKKKLGDMTKLEQQVRTSGMSAQEKREALDEIRRAKIELSRLTSEALRGQS